MLLLSVVLIFIFNYIMKNKKFKNVLCIDNLHVQKKTYLLTAERKIEDFRKQEEV